MRAGLLVDAAGAGGRGVRRRLTDVDHGRGGRGAHRVGFASATTQPLSFGIASLYIAQKAQS